MTAPKIAKVGGVIGACAALGAVGAYMGNAGSSPSTSSAATAKTKLAGPNGQRRGPFGRLRRAVHADLVVPTQGGKFVNVAVDRGVVQKVEGSSLTLTEGTKNATYKSITIDLPSNAVVRIKRKPGKLSDVKAGQRAMVVRGPQRTLVAIRNAKQQSQQ
jgi:hypothetical protein